MAYVAQVRLQVAPGKYREPGEGVPEAADWHNPRPWIAGGYIKEVPEPAEAIASLERAHSGMHKGAGRASGNGHEHKPEEAPWEAAPEPTAEPVRRRRGRPPTQRRMP